MAKSKNWGTLSVWAGEHNAKYEGATTNPIFNSVTFEHSDLDGWYDVATGRRQGHIYSRNTNPTVQAFEEKMRALEDAEAAIAFSTGMAAISNTLFSLLSPGDRVVSIKDSYGGTSKLFLDFLPAYNIEVNLCETTDHEAIEKEIAQGCSLLYLETPTNPTLKLLDLARLIKTAHKHNALVVVDNTFATPINQHPLALGADIVVHSATKFIGGHSDVMGGVACGSKSLIDTIFHFREITGASLHPQAAYMLARGAKTLELRVQRQNQTAQKVAEMLSNHSTVANVFYPGLPHHPGHIIAKKQMDGYGGVLSFSLTEGFEAVKTFLPKLKHVHLAASLGSVSTLAGPPRTTSHVETTPEQRAALGIPESLIRYSVGIENTDDLINDLQQALKSI